MTLVMSLRALGWNKEKIVNLFFFHIICIWFRSIEGRVELINVTVFYRSCNMQGSNSLFIFPNRSQACEITLTADDAEKRFWGRLTYDLPLGSSVNIFGYDGKHFIYLSLTASLWLIPLYCCRDVCMPRVVYGKLSLLKTGFRLCSARLHIQPLWAKSTQEEFCYRDLNESWFAD